MYHSYKMNFHSCLNWIYLLILTTLVSCFDSSSKSKTPKDQSKFVEITEFASLEIGCKELFDSYCTQLYSPDAKGNAFIKRKRPILILKGDTPNNFSQVFFKYSQAKIRHKNKFPLDLLEILTKSNYFDKLENFLSRPPLTQMSLEERRNNEHLSFELGGLWQSAIEQTILNRMNIKFPGYHKIPPRVLPIEYEIAAKRVRREIISSISKAIWREDLNWKLVSEGFSELKISYLKLFDKLDLPPELLNDWRDKVNKIELVLPGSLPEISDEECSTTTINAFYYKYLNLITVCAGDFNSEDIILTLAHEMGHALDLERHLYIKQRESNISQRLQELRSSVCSSKPHLDCNSWAQFKNDFSKLNSELSNIQIPLYDFQKCLKRNPTTKSLSKSDYDRFAEKIITDRLSNLASSDVFLRLVKDKLPLGIGKLQKNPNYQNPCNYYLWSKGEEPIDEEVYTLIFFDAEYRCSQDEPAARLRKSIDVAKDLSIQILKSTLSIESEFSDRPELMSEGFSSSPTERFADVLGTYAVAEYLTKYTNLWERRTKYLASGSWMCSEPSLAQLFPEESRVEKNYSLESHSVGDDRKLELLSSEIRNSISCQKDFEFNECALPFKKSSF